MYNHLGRGLGEELSRSGWPVGTEVRGFLFGLIVVGRSTRGWAWTDQQRGNRALVYALTQCSLLYHFPQWHMWPLAKSPKPFLPELAFPRQKQDSKWNEDKCYTNLLLLIRKRFIYLILCKWVFCLCVSKGIKCVFCAHGAQKRMLNPDIWELLCGCWGQTWVFCKEQVLLNCRDIAAASVTTFKILTVEN